MTEHSTKYFDGEGRASMEACIEAAADWCTANKIRTLVIFTGTGEGPHHAATKVVTRPLYKNLHLVTVTPPYGRPYKLDPRDENSPLVHSGIKKAMRDDLTALGVEVTSAHLPFKEMYDGKERTSEWTRVAEAFGVLGGGFALCIQAVLVACDAGLVGHGERVVALTADTAVDVRACRTESFLSPIEGLLVGHVICRPMRYNISKRFHETISPPTAPEPSTPKMIETTAEESLPALPAARRRKPLASDKTTRRGGRKRSTRKK